VWCGGFQAGERGKRAEKKDRIRKGSVSGANLRQKQSEFGTSVDEEKGEKRGEKPGEVKRQEGGGGDYLCYRSPAEASGVSRPQGKEP